LDLNLPLIGKGLKDASKFIDNLRTDVFQTLKAKFAGALNKTEGIITQALEDVFGSPTGPFGDILTSPDVHVDKSLTGSADDFVTWTFSLGQTLHIPVAFDLGLPVLGLKSDSPMDLQLSWGANLGFGIDLEHGFYFVINDNPAQPELHLDDDRGRDENGWIGHADAILDALSRHGYQEYKREVARSHRDRQPTGGVWQGLDIETGSVASVIWIRRGITDDATVFIDIDGEPVVGG